MGLDINRIMSKLDDYFSRNDYKGAENHLKYWYDEAYAFKDNQALFFLTNELIGFYRKQGNKEKAMFFCDKALELIEYMNIENTVSAGTSYINIATAHKAFDEPNTALPFFEKAKMIYEKNLSSDDIRLAGLYNNMGLAFFSLKHYEKSRELYNMAVNLVKATSDRLDSAITYLNIADSYEMEFGMPEATDRVDFYLDKAKEILEEYKSSTDGYYAFVCDKCASTFGYYGYFLYENQLKERANKIYAGN